MATQINSTDLKNYLLSIRANPNRIQQYMIGMLESLNNGEVFIVDPTNPAIFVLESAAVLSSAVMTDNETKLRRQYAEMANTKEELYMHMSDVDYVGNFSTPAMVNLTFMFDLDEIIQKANYEATGLGVKRLTIPRNTVINVADMNLSLLYPVDIRIMPHGGFSVTLDTSVDNPIVSIKDNTLNWFIEAGNGGENYLNITIPFYQISIQRFSANTNAISGFSKIYAYNDYFCYARAYIQDNNGNWNEIITTHTDLVYNTSVPTVVLKVLNQNLQVTVPQIYFNNGLIRDTVRIDIYTTKGPMEVPLSNYSPSSYTANYNPLTGDLLDSFSSPISTLSTIVVYSSDTVDGGTYGISFDRLKMNVTTRNTVYEGLPISERQLMRGALELGYTLVKNIDNVTDRQYLATRNLPVPSNGFIESIMGVTVETLEISLVNLKVLSSVSSSLYRITVKPRTLYELNNGVLSVIDSISSETLFEKVTLDPTTLVNTINTRNILYSPFYYVFDIANDLISGRIYDLDSPKIVSKFLFQENPTVDVNIGIKDYVLINSPDHDGYIIEVTLDLGSTLVDIGQDHMDIQLSYLGRDDNIRYYLQGTLVSVIDNTTGKPINDNYIYQFKIETQYDIDDNDGIIVIPYKSAINLTHSFDLVTIVKNYNPDGSYLTGDIDAIINASDLVGYDPGNQYIGAKQYKLTINFGEKLDKLWTKTRTVVDQKQIAYYPKDVPKVYSEDIYQLDANGNVEIGYDVQDNIIKTVILHKKGDPVYDIAGNAVLAHKRGDPEIDANGKPVYLNNGDGLMRQIDLFLIDAKFLFGNTQQVSDYRNLCVGLINQWVTVDMNTIYSVLLDRSEIFYHPSGNVGTVKVIADNNKTVTVPAAQSISVTCYLTDTDMHNATLRDSLAQTITKTVQSALIMCTVSLDSILQRLRSVIGDTVISFVVEGFLQDVYKTATTVDDTQTLTLGTIAVALPNLQIDIQDDINVTFLAHIAN